MDDSKGGLDESVIEDGLTPEINESTSAQNEAIQIFSTDAFAHALSGATVSMQTGLQYEIPNRIQYGYCVEIPKFKVHQQPNLGP